MSKTVATFNVNDSDFLRSLDNIATVFDAFEKAGIQVVDASTELGDGFELLKDKNILVGQEIVIVTHKQVEGDHGTFSVAHIVTRDSRKFVIVDGSTGIHAQLEQYTNSPFVGRPIHLKNGLVRSDYEYTDEKTGEQKPATTFYLSY